MTDSKEQIHRVFARYRFRNSRGWFDAGRIRYEVDPETGLIRASHALIKGMPVGGFDGYMLGLPINLPPPIRVEPEPQRVKMTDDPEASQDEALFKALFSEAAS
jgi:hypothetical protein